MTGTAERDPDDDSDEECAVLGTSTSYCPRCGSPVSAISVTGPDDQFVSPCGCRLTPGQIERL